MFTELHLTAEKRCNSVKENRERQKSLSDEDF